MKQQFHVDMNRINAWLNELDVDRNKLFNDLKQSKESNKQKEIQLAKIQNLQTNLINYKKMLDKISNSD